jgi:hypothetical protein
MNVSLYSLLCILCVAAFSARIQKEGGAPAPFLIEQKRHPSAESAGSQQRRNKSEKRLTHVVVPFHYSKKQLDRLSRQSELWRQFPPCIGPSSNVRLVWYVFADPDGEQLSALYNLYNNHYSQFKDCFSGFEIKSAGLGQAEDNPDMSSRRMFEKMLDNSIGLDAPDFVLNIEPDVFPVKADWLTLVQGMLGGPTRRYWVTGSAYLGGTAFFHHTRWACVLYHINGNALYDVGSGDLRRFYFGRVRPFMEKMMPGPSPYDVDIKRFLFSESNAAITRQVRSKFLYSDFIANWWRRPISWKDIRNALPDAIFIHSGLIVNDS